VLCGLPVDGIADARTITVTIAVAILLVAHR
jgi:hypothetical protein